jgi:hypothetical protein
MNCLKSVRFMRQIGTVRITIISIFAALAFFILFYVAFLNVHPNLHLNRLNLPIFLSALILVYPLHKLFHCLPVWATGRKATLSFERKSGFPVLFCDLPGPVSRNLAIGCVAFPSVAITVLTLATAEMFPYSFHYIALVSAINFGLSITDFIYVSFLFKAPSHAYVEDFRDGFHILIQTVDKKSFSR